MFVCPSQTSIEACVVNHETNVQSWSIVGWTFTCKKKNTVPLRITWPCYRGVWMCIAGGLEIVLRSQWSLGSNNSWKKGLSSCPNFQTWIGTTVAPVCVGTALLFCIGPSLVRSTGVTVKSWKWWEVSILLFFRVQSVHWNPLDMNPSSKMFIKKTSWELTYPLRRVCFFWWSKVHLILGAFVAG